MIVTSHADKSTFDSCQINLNQIAFTIFPIDLKSNICQFGSKSIVKWSDCRINFMIDSLNYIFFLKIQYDFCRFNKIKSCFRYVCADKNWTCKLKFNWTCLHHDTGLVWCSKMETKMSQTLDITLDLFDVLRCEWEDSDQLQFIPRGCEHIQTCLDACVNVHVQFCHIDVTNSGHYTGVIWC